MKFSQHIVVHAADEGDLVALVEEDMEDPPPGLTGMRLLRFREKPGRYVIQVDFDSWESAEGSNQRPETQAWADRLAGIIDGEPKYENLDVIREILP